MGQKDCYFTALAEELEPKRNAMAKFLSEAGMKPVIPDGGYFMMADYSNLGRSNTKYNPLTIDEKFVKIATDYCVLFQFRFSI